MNTQGRDTNELLIVGFDGNILARHIKYGGAMFGNIVEFNIKMLKAMVLNFRPQPLVNNKRILHQQFLLGVILK